MSSLAGSIACDEASLRREERQRKVTAGKPLDHRFEDRAWLLFRRLGFTYLNAGRELHVNLPVGGGKRIDVFASDGYHYFVVDCKYSASDATIDLRDDIAQLEGYRPELIKVFPQLLSTIPLGRPHFLIIASSGELRPQDAAFAKEKNIFLWNQRELAYLESLVRAMGSAARFQLRAIVLRGLKISDLARTYPCVRGQMGGKKFYSLIMPVCDVLDYAYVHHRELAGISDAAQAYQRMLNKAKLRKVSAYVTEGGGFFPNNIILGFDKSLDFNKGTTERRKGYAEEASRLRHGTLTLPPYHGCAWVIDGQHRLYGLALTEAGRSQEVPVVAFEAMKTEEQAKLFVDINEKQKRIEGNLLWDLYTDIYRGASTPRERKLFMLASIGRALATEGPLAGHVLVRSLPEVSEKSEKVNIMLTSVCTTVGQHAAWQHLTRRGDVEQSPEAVATVLGAYLEVLQELWPEQWAKGESEDGFLRTNNGFGVFMMIFGDIVRHLVSRNLSRIVHKSDKGEFKKEVRKLLEPAFEHLKSPDGRDDCSRIRTGSSRADQSNNGALVEIEIHETFQEFRPPRIEGLLAGPAPRPGRAVDDEDLGRKAERAEGVLRDMVQRKLVEVHGASWWDAVPKGVRDRVEGDHSKQRRALGAAAPRLAGDALHTEQFKRCGFGELLEVVIYKRNWPAFQDDFGEQQRFQIRVNNLSNLRASLSHVHPETMTPVERQEGIAALLWLSGALGSAEISPEAGS